jgi:hypothetical protein
MCGPDDDFRVRASNSKLDLSVRKELIRRYDRLSNGHQIEARIEKRGQTWSIRRPMQVRDENGVDDSRAG